MRVRKPEIIGLLLVATLPLCSFPLSWLPQSVAHYRFTMALPIAAMVLVGSLLAIARSVSRGGLHPAPSLGTAESVSPSPGELCMAGAILWPSILILLSWLLAVSRSQRPYVSIGVLPTVLSDLAVFFLAMRFPVHAWRKLFWVWLVAAGFVAVNGVVRLGTEAEFVSTVGNRNFLAAYLAASIVLGVALWNKRVPGICALLLVVFPLPGAMWFCRSRGAWLALGVTALLWLFWGKWGKPRTRVGCRILAVASVMVAITLGSSYVTREWRTEVRPMIWQSTLRMIAERPFLGHGLGTFVTEYPRFRLPEYFLRSRATNVTDHAHNELLEITAEQGLLGLAATLWLWGAAVCHGLLSLPPSGERRRLGLGILGATVVLFFHGMLDVGLRYPPNETLFWFLLGLLASGGALTEDASVRSGTVSADPYAPVLLHSRLTRAAIAGACILGSIWFTVTSVVQPVAAQDWERRARMAEERGDLVEAVTNAQRSLAFQPFRPTVGYLLAGVLEKLGARDQAIEQCLRLEELSPDYADVAYNLGRLYAAQGRPEQAVRFLSRAVRINPYDADRQVALATTYRQLGQTNSARTHLEDALRLDPRNAAARDLLAELGQEKLP